MSMNNAAMATNLNRDEIWSAELKEILLDELAAQKWVDWITEFPDGSKLTIPSVGQASAQKIYDDVAVSYESLDTGEFGITVTEYAGSAHYMTDQAEEDSFYGSRVRAMFVPKEHRALMEVLETDILRTPSPDARNSQGAGGQTANNKNLINAFSHRIAGSGTSGTVSPIDFAYAKLSLKKANVPLSNLVAIVDPTVGFALETLTNLVNVSNNPQWEGIVSTGITTGMRFIKNIYGFDVWESNYLDLATNATDTAMYTYAGTDVASSITTNGVQNIMFSAERSVLPIVGVMRRLPRVESEREMDYQRWKYLTTMRYGLKLYRPENMICYLTKATL